MLLTGPLLDSQAGMAGSWPKAGWLGPGGSRREVGGILALAEGFGARSCGRSQAVDPCGSSLAGFIAGQVLSVVSNIICWLGNSPKTAGVICPVRVYFVLGPKGNSRALGPESTPWPRF